MTNLDSILKSRDITLPTKIHLVKVMVFPIVMYGCESWTIHTKEYYLAAKKNTFESVLMRWMKLEPIIHSEVSEKEKHQYSILYNVLIHIYGI